MKDFKNLKILQEDISPIVEIYKISNKFPQEELYGKSSGSTKNDYRVTEKLKKLNINCYYNL